MKELTDGKVYVWVRIRGVNVILFQSRTYQPDKDFDNTIIARRILIGKFNPSDTPRYIDGKVTYHGRTLVSKERIFAAQIEYKFITSK